MRPMRDLVFIHTDAPPDDIITPGGIILTQKWQDFYKGYPNEKLIRAQVVSAGPLVRGVKAGEFIAFQRLFFMRHSWLSDGSLIGWIKEANILGHIDEDAEIGPAFEFERKTSHSLAGGR